MYIVINIFTRLFLTHKYYQMVSLRSKRLAPRFLNSFESQRNAEFPAHEIQGPFCAMSVSDCMS